MAFDSFTLTRSNAGDDDEQASGAVTVAAGEAVRVRFTDFPGVLLSRGVDPFLTITANGVTSRVLIDNGEAWVTGAVAEGDVVAVVARFEGSFGTIAGIVEGFGA